MAQEERKLDAGRVCTDRCSLAPACRGIGGAAAASHARWWDVGPPSRQGCRRCLKTQWAGLHHGESGARERALCAPPPLEAAWSRSGQSGAKRLGSCLVRLVAAYRCLCHLSTAAYCCLLPPVAPDCGLLERASRLEFQLQPHLFVVLDER